MSPELTPLHTLQRATAPEGDATSLPKTVMVFAHPDDETVALGARLGRFVTAHLIHVTDGAPKNGEDSHAHGFSSLHAYREARNAELERALDLGGLNNISRQCLAISDQEASLHLVELTHLLRDLLEEYRPEVIVTHPYEGGHPDHDACAFAVHSALELIRAQPVPLIIEASFYHAGQQGIETGTFLHTGHQTEELLYQLSPAEQRNKAALFACFETQQSMLQYFPLTHERFRIAPSYDFTTPPHGEPVFYDRFSWGMTSQRFCELTRHAQARLREEAATACR
jgi:LmbE family N-acetylglucosaminyl deacetylase